MTYWLNIANSHLLPSFGVTPFEFLATLKNPETSLWWSWQYRFRNLSLRRFDTVSGCDRQTDTQTDSLW